MNKATVFVCGVAASALAACGYAPGGSGVSNDTYTYYSLPNQPVTVTLVDTRTGKPCWSYEVPVGRQLTFSFTDDFAPENTRTPTKLTWQEFKRGTKEGSLENSMLVPDRYSRRIDVEYRKHPEMPQAAVSESAESK